MHEERRAAESLTIGGVRIEPGRRRRLELFAAQLPTGTTLTIPVVVVHGRRPGPRLWLDAAVHGDELNGVEIIRRVLASLDPRVLRGAVLAVPIVNVLGFVQQSRYLPDRRDLNRSFPGSPRGSLAARLAHLFMTEIVGQATHGIDLHTAAHFRENLPQVRADLDDPETRRIALAFGAPVAVHARGRDGSLREAATRRGIPVLVYEGGEPLRFDARAVDSGVRGVLGVLGALDMIDAPAEPPPAPLEARTTTWVRARAGGILRLEVEPGLRVEARQVLGRTADVLGEGGSVLRAPVPGVVIGVNRSALVHRGDAVVHLAEDRRGPDRLSDSAR